MLYQFFFANDLITLFLITPMNLVSGLLQTKDIDTVKNDMIEYFINIDSQFQGIVLDWPAQIFSTLTSW